ncbi:proline-rich receptor-like protein kinase PERK12 isoform X4 [Daucus carota subsp. sativus]|uniref:proline-rich receptor-like protein kinase PERK12 isoform X4 n=1 Tax=Daucus carota subsp. sativus TaxID=79200 RepID=UPI003082CF42
MAYERPSFVRQQPPLSHTELHPPPPPPRTELPPIPQAPSHMEVDSSAPTSSLQPTLPASHQKHPRDDDTEADTSGPQTSIHVSHKRPRVGADIQVPDQTRPPEETPIVISSPPTTQVPDQTRLLEETPISFAEALRDNSEMDTLEDRMFDSRRRGNKDRSGDMTRPLKNRKIRWLFRECDVL